MQTNKGYKRTLRPFDKLRVTKRDEESSSGAFDSGAENKAESSSGAFDSGAENKAERAGRPFDKLRVTEGMSTCDLMHAWGVCVIIPVYNNVQTIGQIVGDVKDECRDVIVVDDGSTDGTGQVLEARDDILVVGHTRNRGKGAALKSGFKKAREMGYDYAITIDGDGQHYAKEIRKLFECHMEHPGALVVGSRKMHGIDRRYGSSFANELANFWVMVQTGRRLRDTQSGMRLYPLNGMGRCGMISNRYESELELLVGSIWRGIDVEEVPVDVYYPPLKERVSHFRPMADFSRITLVNMALTLLAVCYGWPRMALRLLGRIGRTTLSGVVFALFSIGMITPYVWTLSHLMDDKRKLRLHLHDMMFRFANFVMRRERLPGIRFSCRVFGNGSDKPRMIICNHQSHLDLMCLLMLDAKIVVLTNDWAWHNPFYGYLIRQAGFLTVGEGNEALLPKMRALVDEGYSIAVFPEGTRSVDGTIQRFHQGAFHLAEEMQLELLPVCLYGTGKVLRKHGRLLERGSIHVDVGYPIPPYMLHSWGTLRQQASTMRHIYDQWYGQLQMAIARYGRVGKDDSDSLLHAIASEVPTPFSISRAQRANHEVFALCRGEKTTVSKKRTNNSSI